MQLTDRQLDAVADYIDYHLGSVHFGGAVPPMPADPVVAAAAEDALRRLTAQQAKQATAEVARQRAFYLAAGRPDLALTPTERQARRAELLAMTPAGQAVLDHERQHAPAAPAPTGTVTFAAGTTTRVIAGPRPDGTLTTLETRDETRAERRKRLLSMTPLGKAVLDAEAKAGT